MTEFTSDFTQHHLLVLHVGITLLTNFTVAVYYNYISDKCKAILIILSTSLYSQMRW